MKGYQPKKSNTKQIPPNEGSSVVSPSNINSEEGQNTVATGIGFPGSSTTVNPPMSYGWVCPKCGRVNAPWKGTCDCSKGIAVPNTPPNTPFPLAPYYEPYIPHTPYHNPPIEIPNPYDPYGPYKWGDAPGWWSKGPTCGEKFWDHATPCASPTAGDPNFGRSTTISTKINTQTGGDPNIKAYN